MKNQNRRIYLILYGWKVQQLLKDNQRWFLDLKKIKKNAHAYPCRHFAHKKSIKFFSRPGGAREMNHSTMKIWYNSNSKLYDIFKTLYETFKGYPKQIIFVNTFVFLRFWTEHFRVT